MTWWTFENLRRACDGEWLCPPDNGGVTIAAQRVSIDSRTIGNGEVFVAIRGERFDGHDYVAAARERGAAMVIVEAGSETLTPADTPTLAVADTTKALADLARAYRDTWTTTRVIGVTGSNGKTTTCRLLDAALGTAMRGSCSEKSFNNHIGLPLTLLGAREGDDYVVCEMGTSTPGEIEALSAIGRPDIAIVTSIGRAHLEGLGGIEGVKREKAAIAAHMAPGGLLLSRDVDGLGAFVQRRDIRHETFGLTNEATHRIDAVCARADGTSFVLHGEGYLVPLVGHHQAVNAGVAVVVVEHLGQGVASAREGLSRAQGAGMRFDVERYGDVTVVNDAYNSNPDSVRASIATFAEVTAGAARRVLVLGDMLELGAGSKTEHRTLGEEIGARSDIDVLITVGAEAAHIGEGAVTRNALLDLCVTPRADGEGCRRIVSALRPGDAVLLKGSRGVGLERAALAIGERFAGAEAAHA